MRTIELMPGGIIVVSTLVDIFQSVVVPPFGLIHCLAISVGRRTSQFNGILGCIPEKVLKVLL